MTDTQLSVRRAVCVLYDLHQSGNFMLLQIFILQ